MTRHVLRYFDGGELVGDVCLLEPDVMLAQRVCRWTSWKMVRGAPLVPARRVESASCCATAS